MMEFLRSRQLRSGSYSALYVGVFAGILVAANWLGVQYNETFDFTEQRLYSLSDQTHRVLDGLDRDVTMSYFDRTAQFVAARDMLQRYENASSRVRVEYVDPDQDPIKTEAMNVKSYGTLVIDVGGASQQASSTSEQDITNTIIAALKGEEKTACVVTGHGESASDDMERDGFYSARDEIEGANYQFEDVNLGTDGVPGHCTVLVIPGPSTDLFEPEVDALRGYVSQGGRALVMLRPAFPDQRGRRDEPSPKLVALLAEWGIAARNDVVIDESAIGQLFGGGPFTPLVTDYLYHPIVEPMENVATLFPRARTVEKAEESPDGWTLDDLFETSSSSFATDTMRIEDSAVTLGPESERRAGPVKLAVAGTYDVPAAPADEDSGNGEEIGATEEEAEPEGRIVAVGSFGFASNYGLSLGGNRDLLLNMMNWLTSDEDLISIRPRDPEDTPVDMTSSDMTRVFLGSLVLLPLVIIVTGVWTWWGRR